MLDFFFSSRRRHTRWPRDWSSDVCSSDLPRGELVVADHFPAPGQPGARSQVVELADQGRRSFQVLVREVAVVVDGCSAQQDRKSVVEGKRGGRGGGGSSVRREAS